MSKELRYYTCDVFTSQRFGGNQLAVFPDGRGLDAATMQAIAKEFNFSETTFVLPPRDARHTANVRIFTPGAELPFAGHPTVGTAYVLASIGIVPADVNAIVLEEGIGPVAVSIERVGERLASCTLTSARLPERQPTGLTRAEIADMLGLAAADLLGDAECWSCGLPFVVVPVRTNEALARCAFNLSLWQRARADHRTPHVYPVTRIDATTWKVRMFAPDMGIAEDPATGAAAAAFAGWLNQHAETGGRAAASHYRLLQGEFIGRPSEIALSVERDGEELRRVRVGGASVMVCAGTLTL